MEFLQNLLDILLHLDDHLATIIGRFGAAAYIILFLVIFVETGLVIFPFLPGDSLLFAAGAISATSTLNPLILFVFLSLAAIIGDSVNYWIGNFIGPKAFKADNARFFKKEYLVRTHEFYEKHGGKTIVIARFIPIIRTFAPFVAGIGKMTYAHFLFYNVFGALLWVGIFVFGGFYFGNIPFVRENFFIVILVIIALSLLPGLYEFINHKRKQGKN